MEKNKAGRVSIAEAKAIVGESRIKTFEEHVAVDEALGRVLYEDVTAKMSQPPFRRSAMDGYAIIKENLTDGKGSLKVITEIDAGDIRHIRITEGEAVRIMTGGMVPEGANCIVPQENTDYGDENVEIYELPPRDNICPVGEDFIKGTVIARKGSKVTAQMVSCLVAAGFSVVSVEKKPKVVVITTGSELRASGAGLKMGQIYNSNNAYLKARLSELGCDVMYTVTEEDDAELISSDIKAAVDVADYVITSGGVSVGKRDLIEKVLLGLGADIRFHGIAIKPGMPTMFSVLNEVPVLSLSGNPYAAVALFEYLFPYIKGISLRAKLSEPYTNAHGVPRIVRGYFNGEEVTLELNQKNGTTCSGVNSNCLVEIPGGVTTNECMITLL